MRVVVGLIHGQNRFSVVLAEMGNLLPNRREFDTLRLVLGRLAEHDNTHHDLVTPFLHRYYFGYEYDDDWDGIHPGEVHPQAVLRTHYGVRASRRFEH